MRPYITYKAPKITAVSALCVSRNSIGTKRRTTANPSRASATERPTTRTPHKTVCTPDPAFRAPPTGKKYTPHARPANELRPSGTSRRARRANELRPSGTSCNQPCLLICCRLRAPLLQEHPILLQCAHGHPNHREEGAGELRTTLQPGLTNRLTKYLRTTQQLIEEGRDAVSSKELGDFTGINPVQVRRDLNAIGFSGTRGVGYQAYDLVEAVRSILGLRQTYNIALVGAGNLGSAIASSTILPKRGFVIHDVFDNDPEKIGRTAGNIVVKQIGEP